MVYRCASLFAFTLAFFGLCFAQVETSTSIRGLITDPTGAAVPNARVTIRNVDTGEERNAVSDAGGSYAFPSVVPGTYDVTVTHPGFKRSEVKNRVAQVTQAAQVDFRLEIGETTESVTVVAAGAELLSTSTAEVAGTIGTKLVEDLPLNGRNFFDLATTLPHVSLQNIAPTASFAGFSMNAVLGSNPSSPLFRSSGIFAAGNRDSATNVSIDGVNVQSSVYRQTTPQTPPSAIQEMKIHVSSMNAEFGNGVAAVNVITRSGTNRFHGEVYEYLRNEELDASSFFNNLAGRRKNPFRQNQFGGALGGPLISNKLFFFGAYEGLRVRQSTLSIVTVPPNDIRQGDFSQFRPAGPNNTFLPTPTIYNPYRYDPVTGLREPFPGNRIPLGATALCAPRPTCVDPVTLKFLENYVLTPNTVIDGIPRYIGDARQRIDSDQGVLRMDWAKSEADRIYGRYSKTVAPTINQPVESLAGLSQNASDQSAVVHWTRILSTNTVNDFMVGYARPKWLYGKDLNAANASAAIGLLNTSQLAGGPSFGGTGYSMNSTLSFLLDGTDNLYQVGDDITHIRGRHNLKFGFQTIERRFYYQNQSNDKGYFNFTPVFTSACPDGNTACAAARNALGLANGGNAFATFLLGTPLNGLFQLNNAAYRGHKRYYGVYAQDSWRVTSKLTLNYGLRYEYWSPWLVPRHNVASFDEVNGNILYVLQNPLDYLNPATDFGKDAPLNSNIPPEGHRTRKLNLAPRIGLAYSVTGSTVFRAGYGIYYDGNSNTNQFSDISSAVAPFKLRYEPVISSSEQVPSLQVQGNFPFPEPTAIPRPNSTPLGTFRFVPGYYPASTVQEWSASIQQRFGSTLAAEISYQGTHAYHLPQFVDVNAPALPQGSLAGVPINARRPFPQWGVIGTWKPIGYGNYHGLGASLRGNYWKGLVFNSSFTFAKNIVSAMLGPSDSGNQHGAYPYIWEGPAQLTPRLRFVNAISYDLPFGPGRGMWTNGAAGFIAGGWTISTIADMTTGAPNRVTTNDLSGTGYGIMPNRVCDPRDVPGGRNRFQWFNAACFEQPAFGTFGNSPIGVYEDPGINNWNFSLEKTTRTGFPAETGALVFRMDLFNAFNHTQWGPASNSTVQSGNVNSGRIGSTRPPRQIQFSLTFRF
ncbi:MAG: TonB-dependent receptor [Bryobacteraceae bacterium]|nr:TonB-dependent receptor [Bryobacterales bacterium]MEB2360774.1 TonB-dependent receptor [Bryobacterales bacterium]NUN01354.1 TonB-dependent receptor [Bryobacteraceae bacterium]